MEDIVEDVGRKARMPLFVFALSFVSAVAIGWNALINQAGMTPAPGMTTANHEGSLSVITQSNDETQLPPVSDPATLAIQTSLKEMNYYDGALDGLSGPATRKAVVDYQSRFGLPQTGQADEELLSHIKFSQKLDEATKFTGSTSARSDLPTPPAVSNSENGQPNLALVQQGLAELGYQPGPIDGKWGEKTRVALRAFQKDHSLTVTGELSADVLDELRKVTGKSSFGNL